MHGDQRSALLSLMSGAVTRIIPPVALHFQEGERCGPGKETQPDERSHGCQDLGWAKWDDVPKSQSRINRRRIIEEGIELMAPHAMQFTETELTNRGALEAFSTVLFSYPHIDVAGTRFTGEWGNVRTRGYDELGKTGEGDERRIRLGFKSSGSA